MNLENHSLKLAFLVLIMIVFSGIGKAQIQNEPIESSPNQKHVYMRNGRVLENHDLKAILKSNPEAQAYMKTAGVNMGFGTTLSIAGGLLVGFPLGTAIGGGDPNWALAGVGVGLFLLSIPLEIGYHKNVKAAVDTYNQSLERTTSRVEFKLGLSATGIGVKLKF